MSLHKTEWIWTHKDPPKRGKRIVGFINKLWEFDVPGWYSGSVEFNEKIGSLMFVSDAGGSHYLSNMVCYVNIQDPSEELLKEITEDFSYENND